MSDDDKEIVTARYPHASIERESTWEWTVWDMDRHHALEQRAVRGLLGIGATMQEAWERAAITVERRR